MQNAITFQMRKEPHPRRPRGSQSGRVKRRDESFQAWRLFHPWLKTFVAPVNPARLTTPGSPRMKEPPLQCVPQLHKNSADKWSSLHHAFS